MVGVDARSAVFANDEHAKVVEATDERAHPGNVRSRRSGLGVEELLDEGWVGGLEALDGPLVGPGVVAEGAGEFIAAWRRRRQLPGTDRRDRLPAFAAKQAVEGEALERCGELCGDVGAGADDDRGPSDRRDLDLNVVVVVNHTTGSTRSPFLLQHQHLQMQLCKCFVY